MVDQSKSQGRTVTFKVVYEGYPDYQGRVGAFVFDIAGNLIERAEVKAGKISFVSSEKMLGRNRIFFIPLPDNEEDFKPTIPIMERLQAFEPVVYVAGKLESVIRIPANIIKLWPICFCWIKGRVIKSDSGRPVCGAKVHICEVDKFWRLIIKLPEFEVLRLRDDLLNIFKDPPQIRPPIPGPDPVPFEKYQMGVSGLDKLSPQPVPSDVAIPIKSKLILEPKIQAALLSNSAHIVRQTLIEHVDLILPFLCYWPWWWRFVCDEIRVVTTDANGRFQAFALYACNGDKPDIYFWVEYEISGVLETVYKPPIPCYTYWDYACGSEVTIRISDERVPACDDEPDLPGCRVQILSIGREVSISEIQGAGASVDNEGLTTAGQPFGGKLEPRIWLSRTALRDGKNIKYYRWSYRRLTTGDGTPLATSDPWHEISRTVVRHYAKVTAESVTHEPFVLGPKTVGSKTNLFEIKPADVPTGGIEWSIVDEREDLASAHFESQNLGDGLTPQAKALNGAGKYELKLELFKSDGTLVDWTAEGIGLEVTNVPAPFGTGGVTMINASDYYRIKNIADHTMAFRLVLRVDNNFCTAEIKPVTGSGITESACGFIEFSAGASITLKFKPYHPNNFATFDFSVKRGVTTSVNEASAMGRVGSVSVDTNEPAPPVHAYNLNALGEYVESFSVEELLGGCPRGAFSEALHVWNMATDGYTRLVQDALNHAGFALIPAP